jgi:hypothetical protein
MLAGSSKGLSVAVSPVEGFTSVGLLAPARLAGGGDVGAPVPGGPPAEPKLGRLGAEPESAGACVVGPAVPPADPNVGLDGFVAAGWDGGVDSSSSSPLKFGWDALLAAAAIALAGFGTAGPEEAGPGAPAAAVEGASVGAGEVSFFPPQPTTATQKTTALAESAVVRSMDCHIMVFRLMGYPSVLSKDEDPEKCDYPFHQWRCLRLGQLYCRK